MFPRFMVWFGLTPPICGRRKAKSPQHPSFSVFSSPLEGAVLQDIAGAAPGLLLKTLLINNLGKSLASQRRLAPL